VGGRRYGMYGHDWRTVPPLAWLGEREAATKSQVSPANTARAILSGPAFATAVHNALMRSDVLRDNPLSWSRLVLERTGVTADNAERVAALQSLLREACETLRASPREAKFYRALDYTYLHPAATQEQAAELMDVPFSTYRRHLKVGVEVT
jgi:hypothetical protein